MPAPASDLDLADWLRLTRAPGLGAASIRQLLSAIGLPARIFAADHSTLAAAVGESRATLIAQARADSQLAATIEATLAWRALPGNAILTLADAAYPQALLAAADPPPLLFLKGRLELLGRPALAIVGSRNATAQGMANAENFARTLAAAGYTIVSGQALGIDTAAHRGALGNTGSTIAIIGTGADIVYPARTRDLAHAIAADGLILSEFPLGTPALAANFPRRNRIISGLARGVLVVEAALRSGSLITARLAGDQGRDVFAIPGSIHSPLSKGCHVLIKQGAKLVDAAQDILEEFGSAGLLPAADRAVRPAIDADDPRERVLAAMGYDGVGLDVLQGRTGLGVEVLSALLLELELEGRAASLPGGLVQRLES